MIKTITKKKKNRFFVMSENELDSVIKFYIQNEKRRRKRIIDKNCRYCALCGRLIRKRLNCNLNPNRNSDSEPLTLTLPPDPDPEPSHKRSNKK